AGRRDGAGSTARRRLERLAARYEDGVRRLLSLPVTVIHGDYYPSNVLVCPSPGGWRGVPGGWGMAGAGAGGAGTGAPPPGGGGGAGGGAGPGLPGGAAVGGRRHGLCGAVRRRAGTVPAAPRSTVVGLVRGLVPPPGAQPRLAGRGPFPGRTVRILTAPRGW